MVALIKPDTEQWNICGVQCSHSESVVQVEYPCRRWKRSTVAAVLIWLSGLICWKCCKRLIRMAWESRREGV